MGEGILIYGIRSRTSRSEAAYHEKSKALRREVLVIADKLKGNPLKFKIKKGISMNVEVTKSDLKTIASKNTRNEKFNAIKNALARDIRGYLRKSKYEGWRTTIDGKHPESVFFAYYSRELGAKTYLCMRKMKRSGVFKPYAIIDQHTFNHEIGSLYKNTPP